MSPVLLLVAVALAAFAVVMFRRASRARTPRAGNQLAHVANYQELGRVETAARPVETEATASAGRRTAEALGRRIVPRVGSGRIEGVRTRLRSAGLYDVTPEAFIGAQLLAVAGGAALALWYCAVKGMAPAATVLAAIIVGYFGFAIPATLVSRRARMRMESIDRQMPELVDLLVVAVEAGLGLGAALDRAASRMTGVLAGELRLVLQEQGLGATSSEALEHLVMRSDTPTIRTFVRTLVQGERLGVPIGQTMRAIASDMRKRRRAHAEELAQKAPIKILFPLVFCIFPALLIVILAPAGISILKGMSGV
jgi:tight adherence protein C